MAFHVGQKIVCVNGRSWPRDWDGQKKPRRGTVYTVRSIFPGRDHGYDEDGVRLVEIVNKRWTYRCPDGRRRRCEVAFRMSRFRPLRTTNIDVFTRMLEPAPREPVPVDA